MVWKHLRHQNIVPLLGVTSAPLQLISEWMPGGDLTEYIKGHQDADRIGLVCSPYVAFDPTFTPAASYLTSPKACSSSTPTTLSTAALCVYVVPLNLVLPLYRQLSSRIFL